VRAAALEIRRQVLELAAPQLNVEPAALELRNGKIVSTSDASVELSVPEIRALRRRGNLTGVGYRGPNPGDKVIAPFAAHFCEVEVNTMTGEVEITRFLGAHDSGRIMNKLTCQCQVFGGITMGIGYGMTERRILDGNQTGKMVNRNWHDYRIPTAMDVPADMTFLPIEPEDTECNTVGAKGIGEPATIPTAAAVANAIAHATGVRVTDTPIDPTRLMQALAEREGE
jgi:xanthine dehydrogenase YagR molybdenum-binding subunit